jgi:uncharacterized membrane protein
VSAGPPSTAARHAARWLLAAVLLVAGTAHLVDGAEFLGQVPPWLPLRPEIVAVSGLVELALGAALLLAPGTRRALVGLVVAVFFVLVFPGNVSQYVTGSDAFGLDTDRARLVRLFFQPLLVCWALWCTGAWRLLRRHTAG